jgi:dGTPase
MTAPELEDPSWVTPEVLTAREHAWAATMHGYRPNAQRTNANGNRTDTASIHLAHETSHAAVEPCGAFLREEREEHERSKLAAGATHSNGSGERAVPEAPDPVRTCFERDRDRILHGTAFRRLAGKTQVFIFPGDHQRTRLTHALEVAQVARSIAQACRLNVALAEAIALGHDCGHGPGGHASEDALSPYVPGGYDHAVWGADVVLAPLNLCRETLDGIRNHSWSRPAPQTPEGEVVSWADRIAYVCHDFEDAVHAEITTPDALPPLVREVCGTTRSSQLNAFILGVVEAVATTGMVGMTAERAEALAVFRRANYERIYLRPESRREAAAVTSVLQALVEHYAAKPHLLPSNWSASPATDEANAALHAAVTYVGGMTDRFACSRAVAELDWDPSKLPHGIGVGSY